MRRMGREPRVQLAVAVGRAARPRKGYRIIRHAGADRIEFDVAMAVQAIAFGVASFVFQASFPSRWSVVQQIYSSGGSGCIFSNTSSRSVIIASRAS